MNLGALTFLSCEKVDRAAELSPDAESQKKGDGEGGKWDLVVNVVDVSGPIFRDDVCKKEALTSEERDTKKKEEDVPA